MNTAFEECRNNLGPVPRKFVLRDRPYLLPAAPSWLFGDPLRTVLRNRKLLLSQGRVAAAALVHAHTNLLHPGTEDLPALAVWSEGTDWEQDTVQVREWGYRLTGLRGRKTAGDLHKLAQMVIRDDARPQNYQLPAEYTGGRTIFLSALPVWRRQLPSGYLRSTLVPLLVLPESTSSVLLLPGRFWPAALKDR